MSTPLAQAAEKYAGMGLHPFPCRPQDKKPLVKWEALQTIAPTADQVRNWWAARPNANIALAMGRGMIAVDLDGDGAEELLHAEGIQLPEKAPRVRTGRGYHVYLAVDGTVENDVGLLKTDGGKPQVDIRGDGGYVIAPPSIHENGQRYMWVQPLVFPLPPAPDPLMALIRKPKPVPVKEPGQPGWFGNAWAGVGEGQRDVMCTKLAGYLLGRGLEPLHVFIMLAEWGKRCTPGFVEQDVRRVVASIAKREAASGRVHRPLAETPLPYSDPEERDRPVHISAAIDALIAEATNPRRVMVPTPFTGLNDCLIGGFRPGQLTYLAARPSIGKSALAIEFVRAAAYAKKRTLFVSLESKCTQVALRALAQDGEHYATSLATWSVDGSVDATVRRVREMAVWIVSLPTIPRIVSTMDALTGIDFLVVDYLQLMSAPNEIRDRRLQIDWLSARLKQIAVEREIPVLCLCSVTRPPAEGRDKAPTLASLRESGQLEHDGDVVLILHRQQNDTQTQCLVAKNRDGRTGIVDLLFRPEYVAFNEIEHVEDSAQGGWR